MAEGSPDTEDNQPSLDSMIAFQAWSGGWMMGIGFGVIVMFIATELPNEFYERSRHLFAGGAIVAFVVGFLRSRSGGLLRKIFTRPG